MKKYVVPVMKLHKLKTSSILADSYKEKRLSIAHQQILRNLTLMILSILILSSEN